jgi:hypothetical protein
MWAVREESWVTPQLMIQAFGRINLFFYLDRENCKRRRFGTKSNKWGWSLSGHVDRHQSGAVSKQLDMSVEFREQEGI